MEVLDINNTYWRSYFLKYIQKNISRIKKEIDEYFDPFANWKIGGLQGEEIKNELFYFLKNEKNSEKIVRNTDYKAFALLYLSYKKLFTDKSDDFSDENWRNLRKQYDLDKKQEYETMFGAIHGIEKIEIATSGEEESLEIIEEDIKSLLKKDVYNNDTWETRSQYKNNYNTMAIVNLYIEEQIKNKVFERAKDTLNSYLRKKNIPGKFEIGEINGNFFLIGTYKL